MRYLVLVLFCLLASGCIRVSFVNMAKVSGYETALDSLQQSSVKWLSENDTLTDSPNDGNIYAVSAKHPVFIANEHVYKKSRFEDATWQFIQELIGEKNYNNLRDSLWISRFVFREGEFIAIDTP